MIEKKNVTILLENSVDRDFNSQTWGQLTATTFYINVFLTQNIDDMGLFTDIDYIPSFTATTQNNLTNTELITLRLPSKTETDYYLFDNSVITGSTDSKKEDLKSYDALDPYKIGFDIDSQVYQNYVGLTISGVSRIIDNSEPSKYTFDANNDQYIGTNQQNSGILYEDYSSQTRTVISDGLSTELPITNFKFISEGRNQTNLSLSALTKEEYLFGIISKPEIKSDVFIDRGSLSLMDSHLRLSEIKNLGELVRYGNGYYKIVRI